MIKEFKVGYYYKYTGKARKCGWNKNGKMDKMLDGKWRKCIKSDRYYANFIDIVATSKINGYGLWNWSDGIENFKERKHPPKSKKAEEILKNWK
jgi:hypothetical protein